MQDTELRKLVRGVRLLSLDAGNTVIFLDHARLARWAAERGFAVTAGTLIRTEGEAKLLQERGKMLDVAWDGRHLPGALGWGRTVGTILHRAGVPEDTVRDWLGARGSTTSGTTSGRSSPTASARRSRRRGGAACAWPW